MLFICTKTKNIAVAFLVLLVFKTTSKKKTKNPPMWTILLLSRPWNTKKVTIPPHTNNLVVITPLEYEKSYKTPLCEQSCCYHALGTRKNFGAKKKLERKKIWLEKNSNLLIEVNDKKISYSGHPFKPAYPLINLFKFFLQSIKFVCVFICLWWTIKSVEFSSRILVIIKLRLTTYSLTLDQLGETILMISYLFKGFILPDLFKYVALSAYFYILYF